MNLKALFEDDGAVSPVIGVILMVAITVILAAVIGTFVLGLGDRVSEAQPTATWTFDYDEGSTSGFGDGTSSNSDDAITVTHDGGDSVEADNIDVQVGSNSVGSSLGFSDGITAGDSDTIEEGSDVSTIDKGQSVKIIWSAPGSDKTAVIGESEVA